MGYGSDSVHHRHRLDQSIVFARWRECNPQLVHGSFWPCESASDSPPKRHFDRFIHFSGHSDVPNTTHRQTQTQTYRHTHTHTHTLDCTVGTTDRFLSSMSPFMYVESNSGVADPGAAAARPCTTVVEWLCTELPDCSSMLES